MSWTTDETARLMAILLLMAVGSSVRSEDPFPTVPDNWLPPSVFEDPEVSLASAVHAPKQSSPAVQPADPFIYSPTDQPVLTNSFQVLSKDALSRTLATNFTAFPDFNTGISIQRSDIALKIGGYVKSDLIYDFNAIDSTDVFDTTTIQTSGPNRKNARFHARQSRLSFDTRWRVSGEVVRAYIESDFFGGDPEGPSNFRLRHAYGNIGNFTAGQTWTTFTDPSALPQTLDFEGAVSSVKRRQGLVRWDQRLGNAGFSVATALEDPGSLIVGANPLNGHPRSESPDWISRLRLERDWGSLQIAMVLRELGYQPIGEPVISGTARGVNFTGSALLIESSRAYFQITYGDGIGSYRGSPDVVATGPNTGALLPVFGWMVGVHHEWSSRLTSNFTFSRLGLGPVPGQSPDDLKVTNYLAVNLIANPYDRVFCGIEYLNGLREDIGGATGDAHRLQSSFGFFLP